MPVAVEEELKTKDALVVDMYLRQMDEQRKKGIQPVATVAFEQPAYPATFTEAEIAILQLHVPHNNSGPA